MAPFISVDIPGLLRFAVAVCAAAALHAAPAAAQERVPGDTAEADSAAVAADTARAGVPVDAPDSIAIDTARAGIPMDSAVPAAARERIPTDTIDADTARARLRLGLEPIPLPFSVRLAGRDTARPYWVTPLGVDRAAAWAERLKAELRDTRAERRRARYGDPTRTVDTSAVAFADTVEYLPRDEPEDTAPRTDEFLPDEVAQYTKLGIQVDGRGEMGGAWQQFRPCEAAQLNCDAGITPQLRPDVQFGVLVGGTITDRIHVNVDYDQRREFDAANNINVYYQGLEDEILQRVEVGDVSIRLPASRFLTAGVPGGNFGFKATGQVGPIDFQGIWAEQQGDVKTESWDLAPGGGSELFDEQTLTRDDGDYVDGQFFFIVDPRSIPDYPHIDVLALRSLDVPDAVLPDGGTLQLYRDEGVARDEQSGEDYFFAKAAPPGAEGDTVSGRFRRLEPNEFTLHSSGLWITLRQPLREDETIAMSYVTAAGDTIGTIDADRVAGREGGEPVVRLLRGPSSTSHFPGSPTWDYEMHQIYRVHGSTDVELSSLSLEISLGQLEQGRTFASFQGRQIPFLTLFGLDEAPPGDQVDEVQVYQPARNNLSDSPITGTFVVFPTLRPFAAPPGVPSENLTPEEAATALAADANPVIYDERDPEIREGGTRFRLNFEYRVKTTGVQSNFSLGAIGIREGSEKITVGGVALERDVDYEIDYELGQVRLTDPQSIFGTRPDAKIEATFEQKPQFQVAPKSLFGMNATYDLGTHGELNLVGVYQSERSLVARPQLGVEASSIFLGGASGSLHFDAGWLDRAMDGLPGLRFAGASSIDLAGEIAMSAPNPNTQGYTYVDDFEATDDIPISMGSRAWSLGSRPGSATGDEGVFPAQLDIGTAADLVWQDQFHSRQGLVGPLPPQEVDALINVAGRAVPQSVMYLTYSDSTVPAEGDRWRSITNTLAPRGRDLSSSEFIEFYVARDEHADQLALVFDIGTVSEDAFYVDTNGQTSGIDERGEPWGLGVLDEEGRLSEGELWSPAVDAFGLWDQDCEAREGAVAYPLQDPRANCTRGNRRIDTEDLNGDGVPDLDDGEYFRYTVPLGSNSPYVVRDTAETGTAFRRYRVPLRGAAGTGINGADVNTWRRIRHLRMTVAGPACPAPDQSCLVVTRMRIKGSRWTKRQIDGVMSGRLSDEPSVSGDAATVRVGSVSRVSDGADYSSPPGISNEVQDPNSAFGASGVEFNEKALRIEYEGLRSDERAEVYYRFPQDSRNFLEYREMRLWALPRAGDFGPDGSQELLLKVGTDDSNYYLFRTRLHASSGAGGAQRADWLPEVVVDFERWFELKVQAEQALARDTGAVELWSADSTYALILEDRARAPNLAAVRELTFAVYNGDGLPASGEIWLNDIRLGAGLNDPGFAGEVDMNVRAGDFATARFSVSNEGSLFRQLDSRASYQESRSLNFDAAAKLGRFAPAGWGVEMPVTVSHQQGGLDPVFLRGSDVRAARLDGLRETGNHRTRVGVSLRKRTPSANPWIGLLIDGASLRVGYTDVANNSIVSTNETSGLDATLSYGRQLEERDVGIMPDFLVSALRAVLPAVIEESGLFGRMSDARLRYSPTRLDLTTTYAQQHNRSRRFESIIVSPGDTVFDPVLSPKQGLDSRAGIAFRPFASLSAGVNVSTSRDLLPPAEASTEALERQALRDARTNVGGLDVGWERNRVMNSELSFEPKIASWLKPSLDYSARYTTGRNSSYLEVDAEGADTAATLQRDYDVESTLARSLTFDPERLVDVSFGPAPDSASGFGGAVRDVAGAIQPIELTWGSDVRTSFEREIGEPGYGYRLGLGGMPDLRAVGGDTAALATERTSFEARTGLDLPLESNVQIGYSEADRLSTDGRGRRSISTEEFWPDVRLTFGSLPTPGPIGDVLVRATATTGYRRSVSDELTGGGVGSVTGAIRSSIPVQVSLTFLKGVTASYTASFTDVESRRITADTRGTEQSHNISVRGSFPTPMFVRKQLREPIRVTASYTYGARNRCRETDAGSPESTTTECNPWIDSMNRNFNLTLDTVISDLNFGLQVSYDDRQSFIGVRNGSSQLQVGIFGQFHMGVGSIPSAAGGLPSP